ncbi:MAG TPA: prepilin peptidase [Paenirhodobacter sp.]
MIPLVPATQALIFLLFVTPICAWVIFTDLKYMKIRNHAVLALLILFLLLGPIILPIESWLWRWWNAAVVLIIGLILHFLAGFGAGDVKFAAAATLFVPGSLEGLHLICLLLPVLTVAALLTHRTARALPPLRRCAPDWVSWNRAEFPFGIPLAGTLWLSLMLGAFAR